VQFLRGSAPSLGLDPDRIVVHGASAGARIGAVAYTTPGDPLFAGGELWPGVPDHVDAFVGFYSTYDGSHQYDTQYYGGDRDDLDPAVRAGWSGADALANAANVVGPAAFFTGELDWAELATQQEQFAAAVEAAGYQASTFVADGGEHGYDSSPSGLTEGGLIASAFIMGWLDGLFPQD
jgi:acetyl esterase/lipase